MKISWRPFLMFLALALLLGLAVFNRALFVAYLIEPIARILWLIYRTFLAIDQAAYWMLLVFLSLVLIPFLIPARQKERLRSAYYQEDRAVEDRVAHWNRLLRSAEADPDDRQALQRELDNLNRSIEGLAGRNGEEPTPLPPVRPGIRKITRRTRRHPFIKGLAGRRSGRPDTELEKSVDRILQSMESKLETNHERTTGAPDDD